MPRRRDLEVWDWSSHDLEADRPTGTLTRRIYELQGTSFVMTNETENDTQGMREDLAYPNTPVDLEDASFLAGTNALDAAKRGEDYAPLRSLDPPPVAVVSSADR